MNIGERIRILRKKEGLSQIEFCKKIKLSQGRLSEIEQGKNNPAFDTLVSIKSVFNISLDWLVTGEYSKSNTENIPDNNEIKKINVELCEEEIELIQIYRTLNEREKGKLEGYLDGFMEKSKKTNLGLSSNYQTGKKAVTDEKKHA